MSIERTKHDSSFSDKVKNVGYWYYVNGLVSSVIKKGNNYTCKVDNYEIMLEFSNNRKEEMDDYECTCSYYDNVDNCCPHIYALICCIF